MKFSIVATAYLLGMKFSPISCKFSVDNLKNLGIVYLMKTKKPKMLIMFNNENKPEFTINRLKKLIGNYDFTYYEPTHGSVDEKVTLCGLKIDYNKYVLMSIAFNGNVTCKKCLCSIKKYLQKKELT